MGLPRRLASLTLEASRPSFAESLATARDLHGQRQPTLDQQLAVCHALASSMPTSLPSRQASELVELASAWLACGQGGTAGGSGSGSSPAVPSTAVQLQAEAARLFLALLGIAKVKLQSGACRQLLQQLCRLCRASTGRPQRDGAGEAAAELACACLDLLSQLPQWYPQPPKADLAAAVQAVTTALEQQVPPAGGGSGHGAGPAESPATTRMLCKLLRTLQVLLAEAKKDHGANAATLAITLQRLFTYGWPWRGGSGSGSSTPKRCSSGLGAAPAASAGRTAAPPPSQGAPPSPGKYRPPHARGSSTHEDPPAGGSKGPAAAAAAPAYRRSTSQEGAPCALPVPSESSDSESSDTEGASGGGSGERHHASRVRSGALACLQLLAKADPKSLHGSWTALLPMADAVGFRRSTLGAGSMRSGSAHGVSIAHLLLHDPQLRVRHAAAATLTTLLEGPAQRAYLAVAEARDMERQPVRGFITLSASLGHMLVSLHTALVHSVQHEADALVLASTLRALGTLLLGAPYHRLPPQLLPLCVQCLLGCLARVTPPGPTGASALSADQLPVASACLACLAAAFSSKAAAAVLEQQLSLPPSGSSGRWGAGVGPWGVAISSGPAGAGAGASAEIGGPQLLLQLLFSYAACPQPALQLEAVMALRGVAQQHAAVLQGCWDQLLALGRAGAALPAPGPPPSPRSQQGAADGSVPEKVAQQSVRLPGDYLEAAETLSPGVHPAAQAEAVGAAAPAAPAAAATELGDAPAPAPVVAGQAAAEQWRQLAEQVLAPAVLHSSPLLRAAAQAVISVLSPPAFAALPQPLQQQVVGWGCGCLEGDEVSSVRAAAAKAVGAVAAASALCSAPGGPSRLLAALSAGCRDSVLAVRIPSAGALASYCQMLSQACAAPAAPDLSQAGWGCEQALAGHLGPALAAAAASALPACLRLALAAAADSDKLKPSGLQALGSLFQLGARLAAQQAEQRDNALASQAPSDSGVQSLLDAGAQAVQQCLSSGSARVQWAACEAAGQLLSCPAPPAQQPCWSPLLHALMALLRGCPNFRSRALAAVAVRHLTVCHPGEGQAVSEASAVATLHGLLGDLAGVLVDGKASGFAVPATPSAGAAAGSGHDNQQQQRPEPADFGSKSQLEGALVAAVLHLLLLICSGTAGAAQPPAQVALGSSQHAAQLRALVRQVQQEVLAPAELTNGLGPAAATFGGDVYFDLSQVPPALAAAAADCLPLLE